jgi:cytochrome c551
MWNFTYALVLCAGVLLLMECRNTSDGDTIKLTQYYNKGEQLYTKHCTNCHQADGSGLGLLYPPIKGSDYMTNQHEVICLIKNGTKGPITVNGKVYDQEMPANPALTNIEIAEIATFIYNSWSFKDGLIDVRRVSAILDSCSVNQSHISH